ncbi:cytochrome C oxidase assembly protein COX15, putative (macronuclear) [Tetrahymena thermophila SB210]|uniref:Cytochrome C oxidase assembly protein COX15, putative n=1 Tax=Tetrahymena thermophila (strain SB210) TaxID=312017 RepID=I7MB50_TETTS|nr:cytochrome C oxidase assembly protein COX15, putative [Tetrahymena thermophila SB210]EAS07659.1 cytochrome C oxidase assembly protein COX15, putative [Tetrahymena thermophila SB210]|eukprot:XP_001027901.1 cytochrome C oxidase assembly protein COX15, putative [Tetrahymena thermophila SB210]
MIGLFGKNILKFGRVQALNTGKYSALSLMNTSLNKNIPRNYIRMTKQDAVQIPSVEEATKYQQDFKLDETVTNPVHDLVKPGKEKLIGSWLLLTAAGVFGMIVLGGYTRLTQSGLSMTKWKPIDHKLPSTQEEWEKEFDNYKKYPEYQLVNKNMDLNGFKKIFFVEWAHRLWGSSLGILFGVPLLGFAALGWLKKPMFFRLTAMLGLGGLQGLIGWWMVKSGFEQKPDYQTKPRVSVYRLFTHLNMAIVLYGALLWNGLTLIRKPQQQALQLSHLAGTKTMRGLGIGLLHFVALNIMSGAIVAGIDAGKGFNTWPDMNGQMIPDGLMKRDPWYLNFFENRVLVQFNHRNCAYLTASWTGYMLYKSLSLNLAKHQRFQIGLLSFFILYQIASGITVLLHGAPPKESSGHQATALMTVTVALLTCHSFRKPSKQYLNYVQKFIQSQKTI